MGGVLSYQNTSEKGQKVVCLEFISSQWLLAIGPLAWGIMFILHLSVIEALREVKADDQHHVCTKCQMDKWVSYFVFSSLSHSQDLSHLNLLDKMCSLFPQISA